MKEFLVRYKQTSGGGYTHNEHVFSSSAYVDGLAMYPTDEAAEIAARLEIASLEANPRPRGDDSLINDEAKLYVREVTKWERVRLADVLL